MTDIPAALVRYHGSKDRDIPSCNWNDKSQGRPEGRGLIHEASMSIPCGINNVTVGSHGIAVQLSTTRLVPHAVVQAVIYDDIFSANPNVPTPIDKHDYINAVTARYVWPSLSVFSMTDL